MITALFIICMIGIFGKIAFFALKATWGLTKVLFTLLFLPAILIIVAVSGLISIAFPVLLLIGGVMLLKSAFA